MSPGAKYNPGGNGHIIADEVHARVHLGQFFTGSYIDTDFTNGEVADIVLVVGRTSHIVPALGAGVDALLQMYENAAYGGGTSQTITNHNRYSSKVSGNSLVALPTVSDPGDFLEDLLAFGGSGGQAVGGQTGFDRELILAPGNYLFRVTNLTTTASRFHLHLGWYEPGA